MKHFIGILGAAIALAFAAPASAGNPTTQTCSLGGANCLEVDTSGAAAKAIYGKAEGDGAIAGVSGYAFGNDGAGVGVYGYSNGGNGVSGQAPRGGLNGVQGQSASPYASGVYGVNISGNGYGVAGRAHDYGIGVYGDYSGSGGWAGYFNGDVFASGVYSHSDLRLKKDIADIRYGLTEIKKLRPVTFHWKKGDASLQLGLIAQEAQTVLPELVTQKKSDSDLLSLNYVGLIPVLVRAVQEQQAIIEQQGQQIRELQQSRRTLTTTMPSR